ncbi:MarR family transcriptional regulator [Paenibacillus doosanensis]|uniref:HTH-type transcriptional regulator n=1 Tax=Paenibacillus konkukensis TaxID=2020716 RepID=A0ABY4RTK5_9BACL|nr:MULTISPECIES: MarR family transcriptional regulator [Paenibacillus]MCS7464922.1 MarR family transcriptional regulator [Paenibacillus doosanensis]UQZ85054.1 putative HTH-type transcriptional regulator [Paenibacillus konkukensis]
MINHDELSKENISDTLLDLFKTFAKQDRKNRDYGVDEPLFHSEIYTLNEIREHEGIHITALAERCGVTKGAISQVLKKLEQKGLVIKEKDVRNQSRLILKVTAKGEIAYARHLEYQNQFKEKVVQVLKDAPDDKVRMIKDFLIQLEQQLDD